MLIQSLLTIILLAVLSEGESINKQLTEKVFKSILEAEKRSKSDNFRANLVELRGGKGRSLFVTQCYIWHSPVKSKMFRRLEI